MYVCPTVEQVISGPRHYLLINKVIVEMSYKILFVILSIYVGYASLQFIWLLFLPATSSSIQTE